MKMILYMLYFGICLSIYLARNAVYLTEITQAVFHPDPAEFIFYSAPVIIHSVEMINFLFFAKIQYQYSSCDQTGKIYIGYTDTSSLDILKPLSSPNCIVMMQVL